MVSTSTRFALIGLGSIGQRMLRHAITHPRVSPAVAFDPDPAKCAAAQAIAPDLIIANDVSELIHHDGVDFVYLASPPLTHAEHGHAVLDASKPVLCEKPLGIDVATSRDLVAHANQCQIKTAVNFIYASGVGSALTDAVTAGELGTICGAQLRLHARQWAERRYAEAPWLALRHQGGLVREVVSHYIYLAQRLFNSVTLRAAYVDRREGSDAAETVVQALFDCNGVTLQVNAETLGRGPDEFAFTLYGERGAISARNLYSLFRSDGTQWRNCSSADPAADWFSQQLDNIANWAGGEAHTMPDFQSAFSVQQTVESILA